MPWISTQYLSFFFSPCPPFFLCFLPPPTWGLTSIFLVLLPFGFRLGLANGRKWQEVSGQRREWLGYYFPIWSVPWLWDDCVTYEYSSRWVPALLVLGFIGLNHTISSLFLQGRVVIASHCSFQCLPIPVDSLNTAHASVSNFYLTFSLLFQQNGPCFLMSHWLARHGGAVLYCTSLLLLGLPLLHLQHGGFGLDYISQTLFHVKCSLKKRFHPSALLTGM